MALHPAAENIEALPSLDSRAATALDRLARACSLILIVIAGVVLAGWVIGWGRVAQLGIFRNAMAPNASIGLVVTGIALWLVLAPNAARMRAARALATIPLALGGLTLVEYLGAIDLGVDQLFLDDPLHIVRTGHPARMASLMAVVLTLGGTALLALDSARDRGRDVALWLSLPMLLMGLLALFGLGYNANQLLSVSGSGGIAPHTVAAMLVLAVGILCSRPGRGPAAILCAAGDGGILARRLIPMVALLPPLLGWLLLKGAALGLYGIEGQAALAATLTAMLLAGLSWTLTRSQDQRSRERQSGEQSLRLAHERLRRFVDSNIVGVVVAGADGSIAEANDYYLNLIGYSRAELRAGKVDWRAITPPEWSAADAKGIRELRESGFCTPYEKEYVRRDGSRVWVHLSDALLPGVPEQIAAFVLDITERKRAEHALRASEARFRGFSESIPQLIWTCTPDGACDYLSPQWVAYTGIPAAQQLGARWLEQVHPDDHANLAARWNDSVKTGNAFDVEFRMRRSDGAFRWFKARALPLRDTTGRIVQWLGTNTDMEDRVQAEATVRALNATLEQRVRERTTELEAANRELEAFAYSVSHDLRAPLRTIDGFSKILEEDYAGKIDDEGRDSLRRVRAAAQKMAQLIDDILKLSRLSRSEMNREAVDLTALARAAGDELRAAEPGRRVELSIAPGLATRGDSKLLKVVFDNLLGNAWKFTSKHAIARIEVGITSKDGQPAFFVRDDGAGFDMAYAKNLFAPFQRLHGTAEFPGTGIGLATVRRVVQRHGGSVWAEGAVEKGATFYFTLGAGGLRATKPVEQRSIALA